MKRTLFAALMTVSFLPSAFAAEARHADHEALRAMLKDAAAALNARDVDALAPLFRKKFSAVTVDQRRYTSLPELKAYFDGLFTGDKALLKGAQFNPQADDLTEFVAPNVGVAHGTSVDTYNFSDGDTRAMTSRWSAVVVKEGRKWKLASLHVAAPLMENPYVDALKAALFKAAAVGALIGLALGFLGAKALAPGRSRR